MTEALAASLTVGAAWVVFMFAQRRAAQRRADAAFFRRVAK